MLNTFPSNSVGASAGFSSSATTGSIYPNLSPSTSYRGPAKAINASSTGNLIASNIEGFSANGDYFILPSVSTDTIDYFDNTGNQIVSGSWASGFAHTGVDATCDGWVGFMLDNSASLMYVVARDTGLDKFFLASIDVSGTLTNIGSGAIPTTSFGTGPLWGNPSAGGAGTIYRTADGSGNIFVRANDSNVVSELELSITTGAVITDTVAVATNFCPYKTNSGRFVGNFTNFSSGTTGAKSSAEVTLTGLLMNQSLSIPDSTGVPFAASGLIPLQWGGNIVFGSNQAAFVKGVRAITPNTFDAWVDNVALAVGAS